MKKTKLTKVLAMVVCLCTMLTMVPAVFAAGPVQYEAINSFWTFEGWDSTQGLPQGINKGFRIEHIINKTDEDGVSNVMSVNSNTKENNVFIPFKETVTKGMLHIGFDAYVPEGDSGALLVQGISNAENNNPLDTNPETGASRHPMMPLISINRCDCNQVGRAMKMNDSSDYMELRELVQLTELEDGIKGSWNKYDVLVDFDSKQIRYFMNGLPIGEVWNTQENGNLTGMKSLWFRFMNDSNGQCNGVAVDNIYAYNYNKTGDNLWDDIKLATDVVEPLTANEGGKILLSFSEELAEGEDNIKDAFYIDSSLFEIKNAMTGAVVSSDTYSVYPNMDCTGLVFEFDGGTVSAGAYEIAFADDTYKGRQSGKSVTAKASFSVSEGTLSQDSEKKYYLDEDFESYVGGIPGNWTANTVSAPRNYGRDAAEGKNGGTAFSQTQHTEKVYYEFDNSIKSGNFTVEFDVYQENSGFHFGFVTAGDLADPERYVAERMGFGGDTAFEPTGRMYQAQWANEALDVAKTAGEEVADAAAWKQAWIDANFQTKWNNAIIADNAEGVAIRKKVAQSNIEKSFVFGNYGDVWEEENLPLQYNLYKSTGYEKKTWYDANGTAVTTPVLKNNTWSHVKLDVDINARKMTAEIDGIKYYIGTDVFSAPDASGTRDLLANMKVHDIRGVAGTANPPIIYEGGIKGISLGVGSEKIGTVKWDNIKVYTDDSLNLNNNFDNVLIGGYRSAIVYKGVDPTQALSSWSTRHYIEVENGKDFNANSADKAIELNAYAGAKGVKNWIFPLDKAVEGGKPFEVELDIKTNGEASSAMFTIGVVAKEDMQMHPGKENYWPITTESGKAFIDHCLISTGISTAGNDGTRRYYSLPEYPFIAMKGRYYGQNLTNQIKTTSGEAVSYVQDGTKWYHIKMTVKPTDTDVLCKYEITDGNGKVYTSDFVSVGDGTATEAIYYKKGIAGIMIQPVIMATEDSKYVPLASDGTANLASSNAQLANYGETTQTQILVDNLKVREIDAETIKVTAATLTKVDGTTEKLGATVGTDVKSISVKFTGKVTNADAIKVYNAETGVELNTAVSLNAAGNEAVISFNSVPDAGTKVVVAIGNKAAGYMEAKSYGFEMVAAEEGDIIINEFRLYEFVADRLTEDETDGMWLPLTDEMLEAEAGKQLKLVIKGVNSTNTDEDSGLFGAFATYESSSQKMLLVKTDKIAPGMGLFELELKDISLTDAEEFKAFIWDMDNLKPLLKQIDYYVK